MKRLVAIGDSIVHGTCSSEPFGLVENNFIKIIGEKLGVGGYLTELRRTKIGQYDIKDAKTLSDYGIID